MKTRIFAITMIFCLAAFLPAGHAMGALKPAHTASSLENEMEPLMKIESWMINESFWMNTHTNNPATDSEDSLPLESWMTDLSSWDAGLAVTRELPLDLESWMTDGAYWNLSGVGLVTLDVPLVMESWMTDEKYWSNPGIR